MLELIVDKAQSLKQFTDNAYAQASFYFNTLLRAREVKVNGKRVDRDVPVFAGDSVAYYLSKKQEEKPAYYTVYEDENILIADKLDGVNSEAVFADLHRKGEYYFIHRLDRNTKGLLVFAKNKWVEEELLSAFKARSVQKIYHARCFGAPAKPQALLKAYLKKDEGKALVKIYAKQAAGAEPILTEYQVLSKNAETSLLEVHLHTGKTHQIRAHLAYIGCPIVGDMKYGDTEKNRAISCTRQQLIAKQIVFCFEGRLSYLNDQTFLSRFAFEE
jgi:23S rRNA pseudouridine955/2504/2580 synthase